MKPRPDLPLSSILLGAQRAMKQIMQPPTVGPCKAGLTIELQFRYKGPRGDGPVGTSVRSADDMTNPGLKYAQDVVQDLLSLGAAVELPDVRLLIRDNARCRCFWETAVDSVSLDLQLHLFEGGVM